jgi:sugar phosphate isomerase/epimerase
MFDIQKELGVQSFCFRGFEKNEQVVEQLRKCGLTRIELCRKHVNFDDETSFDRIIDLYRKNGIQIVAIGVCPFSNNEAAETRIFEFARRAGVKGISANFRLDTTPESFRTAERLAEKYDIRLAIHNHGAAHWLGCSDMLRHVFRQTSPRIGLCMDTAWTIDSREDPVKWVEVFGDRLYGLHIKDFVFERNRSPVDVVVGTGNLNLKGLVSALKARGFSGYAVLEYEADVDNPSPAIQKCIEEVRKASVAAT